MNLISKEFTNRVAKYRDILKNKQLDVLLLTSATQVFYATNFEFQFSDQKEGVALITTNKVFLIVSKMFQNQIKAVFPQVQIIIAEKGYGQQIAQKIKQKRLGFEANSVVYLEFAFFKKYTSKIVPLDKEVQTIRSIKSVQEIENIRLAQQITGQSIEKIKPYIKPGITEKMIAAKLIESMEELGADNFDFSPIVASGVNSANPHHRPTSKKIVENEVVLIDVGAKKNGYTGDMSRTFFLGKPFDQFLKTYNLVLRAQEAAIALIKSSVEVKTIDNKVRSIFEQNEQLDFFIHTTGHGVGIAGHEFPTLTYLSEAKLETNMVVTVEPGLYYPEWGGVRIEDIVVVTDSGSNLLSSISRDWQIPL